MATPNSSGTSAVQQIQNTAPENRPSLYDLYQLRLNTTKQLVQAVSIHINACEGEVGGTAIQHAEELIQTLGSQISEFNTRITAMQGGAA